MPIANGDFLTHGPIEHIAGCHLDWSMLPLEAAAALAFGAVVVLAIKVLRMAAGFPTGTR
jgi:hypothetical protein